MPQTATTGQLANAQRVVVAQARYTMEFNAPNVELIEQMILEQGAKTVTVPKVGQFTFAPLQDGVDMVNEQQIGMTTTDLTSSEVGAKIILTDKLVRQENESVFNIVGRQFGDGAARKKDGDIIALYPSLNNSTNLGATTKLLTMANLGGCISFAKANKFPEPIAVVAHPNTMYSTVVSATVTPMATYPLPDGYAEDVLKRFYAFEVNGVQVFQDGNIPGGTGGVANDGTGAIFSKNAMVCLNSKGFGIEEQRDASLRAWELNATADYGAFQLDTSYGAPMLYSLAAASTSA
jgi:hypothetical protein